MLLEEDLHVVAVRAVFGHAHRVLGIRAETILVERRNVVLNPKIPSHGIDDIPDHFSVGHFDDFNRLPRSCNWDAWARWARGISLERGSSFVFSVHLKAVKVQAVRTIANT